MNACERSFSIRRAVLVATGLCVCGLIGFQCWDMRQYHLRETRLYREFEDVDVIARELTNGGWTVAEAPPLPGPYRLFSDQMGWSGFRGSATTLNARWGSESFSVRRQAPPDRAYWIMPLETQGGRLTYVVLESSPELASR